MGSRAARVLNLPLAGSGNGNGASQMRRFGIFEVDLRAGELRRNGMRVKLQDQPFQILALLLERPGEVITREEVRNRLWPADTFVDFDHSLNAAVRRLRDALGDSAENPTFVETVARRGYRFLAPVVSGVSVEAGLEQPQLVAEPDRSIRHPRWRWIVAGITAIALVVAGVVLGWHLSLRAPMMPAPHITRLTANPVDDPVLASAISRDGRYLAFSDESGFYLRQIDTGETHAITLPDGLLPNSIGWFPDNVHMVLGLCGIDRESSLWTISALGGSARKIVISGANPSVSPDSKQVAYIAGKIFRQRIWLADIDGEESRELAGEDGDLFGRISWSPAGRKVAYTTAKSNYGYGSDGKIAMVDARSRSGSMAQPASVLSVPRLNAPFAWASDDQLIYSQSEPRPREADSNLWLVRLNRNMKPTGAPVRLTSDSGTILDLSAANQNGRIAYIKGIPQPDVYIAQLERSGALSEPQRLTMDDREDLPYDWTPDGQNVIFVSNRTGTFDVYKQGMHKTVPEVLVAGSENAVLPRLSPDGNNILYLLNPSWGDPSYEVPLMTVPFSGGPPRQLAKAKWISNHQCARAPATTCIFSVLGDAGLTFFQFNPVDGDASQVFQIKDELSLLYNWSLSPDGTTLALAKGKHADEQPRIHLVSLADRSERWIDLKGMPALASLDWAADSKSIWATTNVEKENSLLRIDLQGNVRVVWSPKKGSVGWAIPSRDGKYLALHVHSNTANVWMLER
jgi:DNA-binding winged helix-turn-helix (wHTH) protein/Tol biopolymer transport system component